LRRRIARWQRGRVIDAHRARVGVDTRHPALDEVHASAGQLIGNLQVGQRLAGSRLMQAQTLDESGLRVDQRDVDVIAALQASRQTHGRGHAGVSGAENQNLVHRDAFRVVDGGYTPDASSGAICDIPTLHGIYLRVWR
jgi:hypothetical protein